MAWPSDGGHAPARDPIRCLPKSSGCTRPTRQLRQAVHRSSPGRHQAAPGAPDACLVPGARSRHLDVSPSTSPCLRHRSLARPTAEEVPTSTKSPKGRRSTVGARRPDGGYARIPWLAARAPHPDLDDLPGHRGRRHQRGAIPCSSAKSNTQTGLHTARSRRERAACPCPTCHTPTRPSPRREPVAGEVQFRAAGGPCRREGRVSLVVLHVVLGAVGLAGPQ